MIWDVAVIGSGPAGSATALRCARAGLSVAIFSLPARKRSFTFTETLPAAVRPHLEALGFWDEFGRIGFRGQYSMSSAWGSSSVVVRESIFNPFGHGWLVDRAILDAKLLGLAARNSRVSVMTGRIVSSAWEKDHWTLKLHAEESGKLAPVKTRVVVDASGRSSIFARQRGGRRIAFDRLVCITALSTPRNAPALDPLVESTPDGWWFSAPNALGDLVIGYFTDAALLRPSDRSADGLEERLRTTVHTAQRTGRVLPPTVRLRVARTDSLQVCAGTGWFAVGDAALASDPLGSDGVLRAFESTKLACELIMNRSSRSTDSVREYDEYQKTRMKRFLQEQQFFYAMERRWPAAGFWRMRSRDSGKQIAALEQ